MSRSDRGAAAIHHMLSHAREAVSFAEGRTRADLDADRLLNLALVRLLEVIGEAAGRVSTEMRDEHPEIPWPQIIGLRNRLTHGYDAVDLDILWQITSRDLPSLIVSLEAIINANAER